MSARPVSISGHSAGFTLLELMVVLVLIGIIFSFAVLSLGGDKLSELMEQETRRMATLLELAADEAVLRGEELAINFTDDGYEFLLLQEDGGWQSSGEDGLLKAYKLPGDIELRLEVEGEPPELNAMAEADQNSDDEQDDNSLEPQVYILSSGEMTPFAATFLSLQSKYRYHLKATLFGKVSWEVEETL